jgi:hypothetical protein
VFAQSFLQFVLLDGTNLTGDFSSICALPAISGLFDFQGEEIVVADCGGTDSLVNCSCCHCCATEDGTETADTETGCSNPFVANMDWMWESQFERSERDFGLNKSILIDPTG